MGTYSVRESTATLRLLGGVRRGERGGGILCRHAHSLMLLLVFFVFLFIVIIIIIWRWWWVGDGTGEQLAPGWTAPVTGCGTQVDIVSCQYQHYTCLAIVCVVS